MKQVSIIGLVFAREFLLYDKRSKRVFYLNVDGIPPFPSVYFIIKYYPSSACEGVYLACRLGQVIVFLPTRSGVSRRWASTGHLSRFRVFAMGR